MHWMPKENRNKNIIWGVAGGVIFSILMGILSHLLCDGQFTCWYMGRHGQLVDLPPYKYLCSYCLKKRAAHLYYSPLCMSSYCVQLTKIWISKVQVLDQGQAFRWLLNNFMDTIFVMLQPKPKAEILIILDITKTESNNCFIIHWTKQKKMKVTFLIFTDGKQHKAHEPGMITLIEIMHRGHRWHDYPWPKWRHRHWFRKFTVRFRPIRKEISMYKNNSTLSSFWLLTKNRQYKSTK